MRRRLKHWAVKLRRRAVIKFVSAMKGRELMERYILFDTIMGFISNCGITGDYLEFGCAFGHSMADAFHIARCYPLDTMRFHAFDSFHGLPEPSGLDADSFSPYQKGQYACDLDQYRLNLQTWDVDLHRVTITTGWYADALAESLKSQLNLKRAAVVLIDCDLYESTVPVLKFITNLIQDGTVLIFDDWFSYRGRNDRGEARAFREWLADNPHITANEYRRSGRTMTSFVIQIDESRSA